MRIAIVTPDYPPIPGGVSQSVARIAKHIALEGHFISVFVPHLSEEAISRPKELVSHIDGYTVVHILIADPRREIGSSWAISRMGRMPQTYLAILQYLRNWEPDIIHSFTLFPFGLLAAMLSNELSVPFVVGIRGNDLDSNIFRPDVLSSLVLACQNANAIAPVTSDLGRKAQLLGSSLQGKTTIIPNGIEPDVKSSSLSVEKDSSSDFETVTIGTLGIFRPKKDIDILINAFSEFHKHYSNTKLILAGSSHIEDPDLMNEIENALNANPSVSYSSHIPHDHIFEFLKTLDIFVLPSVFDGCPNTLLEAMLAECAIVATNIGGANDLIRNGVNGLLFSPLDTEGLYRCLETLMSNDLRKRISKKARSSIRTSTEEARDWVSLFGKVLGEFD